MGNLIKEALWLPIKEKRDAFFVFWPLGLFYGLLFIWSAMQARPPGEMPSALTIIVSIGAVLYLMLLTISGVVNWHRKLVLGQRIEELNFIPQLRELKYLGFFLAISVMIAVIALIIFRIILALFAPALFTPGQIPSPASLIPVWLIMVTVYFFLIALLSRLFLALPRVSVEEDSIAWPQGLSKKFQLGGECSNAIVAVMVLSSIPSFIISIIMGIISFSLLKNQGSGLVAVMYIGNFLYLFAALYAALSFASVLSLIYRDHVRPALRMTTTQSPQ